MEQESSTMMVYSEQVCVLSHREVPEATYSYILSSYPQGGCFQLKKSSEDFSDVEIQTVDSYCS